MLAAVGQGTGKGARTLGRKRAAKRGDEKWAVMERMPNIKEDFHALVPHPARQYPFELDVFQKEVTPRLVQSPFLSEPMRLHE